MSNPVPKRKKVYLDGTVRWNMRIPPELDAWAKAYAKRYNTTVTSMVINFLMDLKRQDEGDNVPQV